MSLVEQIHNNEQKTKSLETELKKTTESNLSLKKQVDDFVKQVTATRQKQEALIARVHGNEQQITTMSTNLTDKLNQLEQQTNKNFTNWKTYLTAQINIVKILKWDPGK